MEEDDTLEDQHLIDCANRVAPVPARVGGQKHMVEGARKDKRGKAKLARKRPAAAAAPVRRESAAVAKPPAKTPTKQAVETSPRDSVRTLVKSLSTSSCKELKNLHDKIYHSTLKDALVRGLEKEAAKTEARLGANIAKDKYIQENST